MLAACNSGRHLRTVRTINEQGANGNFSLILYGAADYEGLEAIAFLDKSGDDYEFRPHAPEFNYTVRQNLSYNEAFDSALHHISEHNAFMSPVLERILDEGGNTIGYELRPLYLPFVYGITDVLEVDYWLKEKGIVKIVIKLSPRVKRKFLRGDE
jgi:hypothetical protein